ncbi:MAG: protocatechuate 4,5-dioxygenase subunit alpha [Haliea sp.]
MADIGRASMGFPIPATDGSPSSTIAGSPSREEAVGKNEVNPRCPVAREDEFSRLRRTRLEGSRRLASSGVGARYPHLEPVDGLEVRLRHKWYWGYASRLSGIGRRALRARRRRTSFVGSPTPIIRSSMDNIADPVSRSYNRPHVGRRNYIDQPRHGASADLERRMAAQSFEDVPGTVVFDAILARKGYHLNSFFMSLMKAENRASFKADEDAYLARFPMTDAQRSAVRARDWNEMLRLGGNIFFMLKLSFSDGMSVQQLAGSMTGMTAEAYRDMLLKGGRSIEGNRSKSEWANG